MEQQKKYFFAVDLGATSGRTIIGNITDGKFDLEEVTRFPNNLIEQGGHYYWDIYALYFEIIRGLREVAKRGLEITSIGIDTWGVDFVFIGDDGAILRNPRAYRDPDFRRYGRLPEARHLEERGLRHHRHTVSELQQYLPALRHEARRQHGAEECPEDSARARRPELDADGQRGV